MKKTLIKLLAVAAFIGFVNPAFAQTAANGAGTATLDIVTAMTLAAPRALAFGNVVAPGAGTCTVILSAAETTVPSGTCTYGGTQTSAQFDATGDASAKYRITLPSDSVTLAGGTGTAVSVGTFTHSAGDTPALDGTGNATFYVGATATVANDTKGKWTGIFNVAVDY